MVRVGFDMVLKLMKELRFKLILTSIIVFCGILLLESNVVFAETNNKLTSKEENTSNLFYSKFVEEKRRKRLEYLKNITLSQEPSSEEGEEGVSLYHQFISGVNVDIAKAVDLLEKAVNEEDAEAMSWLGYIYMQGIGVDVNKKRANELLVKADKLGSASGSHNLAIYHFQEQGAFGDLVLFRELIDKAIEKNYLPTLSFLGQLEMSYGNLQEGRQLLRKAIVAKDVYAKAILVNANSANAVNFSRFINNKAANSSNLKSLQSSFEYGSHEAGRLLFSAYITGQAGKIDYKQGVEYLRETAALGSGDAYAYLCAATMQGEYGIKKSLSEGVKLCEKGIKLGSSIAMESLATGYIIEQKDVKNYAYATELLRKAINRGNPIAMSRYAAMVHRPSRFVNKKFLKKNSDQAYELYGKSAEVGFPLGAIMYASLSLASEPGELKINSLNQPDFKTCWFWGAVVSKVTPGNKTKNIEQVCASKVIDKSYINARKNELKKRINYYRSNFWGQQYLAAIRSNPGLDVNRR